MSVNMITIKNDYEPIIYEQPFSSHIYENQIELLNNYYIEPTNKDSRVNHEVNTVTKPDKKDKTQCSNTNHIYQNIKKITTKRKNMDNPISLREPKK